MSELIANLKVYSEQIRTLKDFHRLRNELRIIPNPKEDKESYRTKSIALALAFPRIKDRRRLAIDLESSRFITHRRDNVVERLEAIDRTRVFEMFSGCGGDTCMFLSSGTKRIQCFELDLTRFCCLLQNIVAHIDEGLIPKDTVVEAFNQRVTLAELERFAPTMVFCDPPWGDYLESNEIIVEIDGALKRPNDMAAACLRALPERTPVVFKLPRSERYDPGLYGERIDVQRESRKKGPFVAFSLYIVRSAAELARPGSRAREEEADQAREEDTGQAREEDTDQAREEDIGQAHEEDTDQARDGNIQAREEDISQAREATE